jgi:tRNA A-37 threonylcarbamoyl transferase component Bud32
VQHGDLTRDNVVITENGIRLIDCEHAHLTKVPGYDIYNLVSRVKSEDPHAWLDAYSSKLGFTFAENHHSLFPALHELLEAQKKSGRIREKVLHLEKLLSLLP